MLLALALIFICFGFIYGYLVPFLRKGGKKTFLARLFSGLFIMCISSQIFIIVSYLGTVLDWIPKEFQIFTKYTAPLVLFGFAVRILSPLLGLDGMGKPRSPTVELRTVGQIGLYHRVDRERP